MLPILVSALLAVLAPSRGAEQSANTSSQSRSSNNALLTDTRLSQPVSIELASEPLSIVVRQLSQQARVSLEVDAELASHRACLYALNRPLQEVMVHLAQAFDARWQAIASKEQASTYRLVPNQKRADWLRQQAKRRQEHSLRQLQRLRKALHRVQTEMNQPVSYDDNDDDDTGGVPRWYIQTVRQQNRFWIGLLSQLRDSEWQRLAAGETLFFSSRDEPCLNWNLFQEWLQFEKEAAHSELEFLSVPPQMGAPYTDERKEYLFAFSERATQIDEVRVALCWRPAEDDEEESRLKIYIGCFVQGQLIYASELSDWKMFWEETEVETSEPEPEPSVPPLPQSLMDKALPPFELPSLDQDWFSVAGKALLHAARVSQVPLAAELYPLEMEILLPIKHKGETDHAIKRWADLAQVLAYSQISVKVSSEGWIVIGAGRRMEWRQRDVPPDRIRRWFYKPNRRGRITLQDWMEMVAMHESLPSLLYSSLSILGEKYDLVVDVEREGYKPIRAYLPFERAHRGLLLACASLYQPLSVKNGAMLIARLTPAQRQALVSGNTVHFDTLSPAAQNAFLELLSLYSPAELPFFWLSPARQQTEAATGSIRLITETRWEPGYRYPPALLNSIDTLQKLWEWAARQDHERLQTYLVERAYKVQRCSLELRLGNKTRYIPILTVYP